MSELYKCYFYLITGKVSFTASTEIDMQETHMSSNSPRNWFQIRGRQDGLMVKTSVEM